MSKLAILSAAALQLAKLVDEHADLPLEAVAIMLPGDLFDAIYFEATGRSANYGDDGHSTDALNVAGCTVNGWRDL
jgi:hypothetical protein